MSPNDREDWSRAFVAQAKSIQLWGHIDPDVPEVAFSTKPVKPQFSDYFVQEGPTPSTTGTTEDDIPQGTAPTVQRARATGYDQLSEKDQRSFAFRFSIYTAELREFEKEQQSINSLTKWIEDTVKLDYTRSCCQPDATLREWYKNLRKNTATTTGEKSIRLSQRYKAAVRPLTRAPKDFETWVNEWLMIMTEVQVHKRSLYEDTSEWFHDIITAIRGVRPGWVYNIYGSCNQLVNQGTFTPFDMARELRGQILLDSSHGKGKFTHGAFGPTFGNTQKDGTKEEPQKSGKRGKKRDREEANPEKCIVCERPNCTDLSQCWYAFPDQVKGQWKPWNNTAKLAKKNLEKSSVKEKLKELSGKRVKPDQD